MDAYTWNKLAKDYQNSNHNGCIFTQTTFTGSTVAFTVNSYSFK